MAALVKQLLEPSSRATALLKLSKKRESIPYLAPLLWHSFGSVAVLLQEVVAIYPALQPPTLTRVASNRVCNALALLQSVASHHETRQKFLAGGLVHAETPAQRCGPRPPAFPTAHIPLYLYPFLNTLNQEKPFEYLRLTSLGVIGALVKVGLCVLQLAWPCCTPDSRPPPRSKTTKMSSASCYKQRSSRCACASWSLARTCPRQCVGAALHPPLRWLTPPCPLRPRWPRSSCRKSSWTMRGSSTFAPPASGSTQVRGAASTGGPSARTACPPAPTAVNTVLHHMIEALVKAPSNRLLKQVVRCFDCLAEHEKARQALRQTLHPKLRDGHFLASASNDASLKEWLTKLTKL